MVPVVASVLVGTFTGVKYIVNLTDTINANQAEIQELNRAFELKKEEFLKVQGALEMLQILENEKGSKET